MHNASMPIRSSTEGSTEHLAKIGRRLRAIRELAEETQEAVCEVLGVDQSTYSKWERGKRLPDVLVLSVFAARFRASLDFLFRGSPVGLHPQLARLIQVAHPDLLSVPNDKEPDTDTARASYKAAIVQVPMN